jgi:hypothetical protein
MKRHQKCNLGIIYLSFMGHKNIYESRKLQFISIGLRDRYRLNTERL